MARPVNTARVNHGVLKARVEVQGERTVLVEQCQRAPLKLCRALAGSSPPGSGDGLELCVMDASPGLLDGDTAQLDFGAGEGAEVLITSQGFTRVHPCPQVGASVRLHLEVARGARLAYLPEATVLFQDASLRNTVSAQVATGGALIYLETLGAGRVARGECFAFKKYTSKLDLRHGVNLALCAQTRLEPAVVSPRTPFGWGAHTHWANLYLVHEAADAAWCEATRGCLAPSGLVWGASLLPHGGVTVSLLGARAHDLRLVALEVAALWGSLLAVREQAAVRDKG